MAATNWVTTVDGIDEVVGGEAHFSGTTAVSPFNQYYQFGLPVTAGQNYTLSFEGYTASLATPDLRVQLLKHDGDFANLGLSHTFTLNGTKTLYEVTFTATQTYSNARFRFRFDEGEFYVDNVCLIESEPTASDINAIFTVDTITLVVGNTITATDISTSTQGITSAEFDWGDGTTTAFDHNTAPAQMHTYTTAGSYTITLTISGPDGISETTQEIIVLSDTVVDFVVDNPIPLETEVITFTDTTVATNAPTSWLWDFGDGSFSNLQNPTHSYAVNGVYPVTLTVTNADGTFTSSVQYISVENVDVTVPTTTDLIVEYDTLAKCYRPLNPSPANSALLTATATGYEWSV